MKQLLKFGLLFFVNCLLTGFNSNAQNKINSYQYWFDNDYSSRKLTLVSPVEHLELDALLPLENISEGLHIFTIRFKDSKGKWSIPVNHYFYKQNSIHEANKIVAYRYWFNEDIENTTYDFVTNAVQLLTLNDDLDLTGLENGEYIIHFQFKDISGKWSLVTSDNFIHSFNSAIENIFEKTIQVYPNPTSGKLTLKLDALITLGTLPLSYQLYDVNDKLLRNVQLKENETYIDLANLVPSAYLLKVTVENKTVKTFKIIKN